MLIICKTFRKRLSLYYSVEDDIMRPCLIQLGDERFFLELKYKYVERFSQIKSQLEFKCFLYTLGGWKLSFNIRWPYHSKRVIMNDVECSCAYSAKELINRDHHYRLTSPCPTIPNCSPSDLACASGPTPTFFHSNLFNLGLFH